VRVVLKLQQGHEAATRNIFIQEAAHRNIQDIIIMKWVQNNIMIYTIFDRLQDM